MRISFSDEVKIESLFPVRVFFEGEKAEEPGEIFVPVRQSFFQ
jgi:hypothetical protein